MPRAALRECPSFQSEHDAEKEVFTGIVDWAQQEDKGGKHAQHLLRVCHNRKLSLAARMNDEKVAALRAARKELLDQLRKGKSANLRKLEQAMAGVEISEETASRQIALVRRPVALALQWSGLSSHGVRLRQCTRTLVSRRPTLRWRCNKASCRRLVHRPGIDDVKPQGTARASLPSAGWRCFNAVESLRCSSNKLRTT